MNTCNFLVKIISSPKQRIIGDNLSLVEAQIQFTKGRKKKGFEQFRLSIWGKLGEDFIKYYRIGDYIIVQGILSFLPSKGQKTYKKNAKLTVLKVYPFVLVEKD